MTTICSLNISRNIVDVNEHEDEKEKLSINYLIRRNWRFLKCVMQSSYNV